MEHLFACWQDFAAAAAAAPHLLLLSDYDGTLTPIVGDPKDALIPPDVKRKLDGLSKKTGVSVGIISGRAMHDAKALVGLAGIYYAGNHGLEIQGPGLAFVSPAAEQARGLMHELAGRLAEALDSVSGVIIEDKGLSLSVHYRLVQEDEVAGVEATFERVTAELADAGQIKITTGKKVLEARPPLDWHKGKAVLAIEEQIRSIFGQDEILTVYLGDDLTDEDAFKVLAPPRGWSVYVGGQNDASAARYYLGSPQEAGEFLGRLLELE